jgi:Ca-activated chloride channel family protein
VEIKAELKERQKAEADYEEAKRQGRQAALATRESPNVFTLQIAGLQPDQEVRVETFYVQLARAEGQGWSLRIPLTTAPRYVRSDEITSRHAHGQPLFLLRDPGHRFSLDLTFHGAFTVESATHRLNVTEEEYCMRVRLRDGEVIPDRDCVLSWHPQQDQAHPALQVMLHDDRASEQVYFLALVAPPAVHSKGSGVPREVILLVDHSGSMEGAKWEAADWAVKKFLVELTERDSFALCLFHTTTRWFSKTPRKAEALVVEEALRFLEEHKDSGGTELGVALEQALGIERTDGERARHILIITDAQVTDAGRILRLADQESQQVDNPLTPFGKGERRRISVLCIDAAPNSFLAFQLAERGGGVAKFLTSSPEEKDISTALDEVLADWVEPVLAEMKLSVNRSDVQAAGREVLTTESRESLIDLSDLPAGRTIWVAGRAPRGEVSDLTFRVITKDNQEVAACYFDLAKEASEHDAIKALFGARRVMGLEFLIHSGYDPKELRNQLERLGYDSENVLSDLKGKPTKVYAENVREEATEALRGLLVKEALDYSLACSETAFVAVRKEAGKPVEASVAVANALPVGWSDEFLYSSRRRYRAGRLFTSVAQPVEYMECVDMAQPVLCCRMASVIPSTPRASVSMIQETPAGPLRTKAKVLFSGIPQFENGEAVLFDTSRKQDADKLPNSAVINSIEVRFPDGAPEHESLAGLSLLIFVDDLASPKAKVNLTDVIRQRGERPLNLLRRPGQVVRLVLLDSTGAWMQNATIIEVALGRKAMSGG